MTATRISMQPAVITEAPPTTTDAPACEPCIHCRGLVPVESFVYWAHQGQTVWWFAPCPTCGRATKRQAAGPSALHLV
jgi:hypothetical protein